MLKRIARSTITKLLIIFLVVILTINFIFLISYISYNRILRTDLLHEQASQQATNIIRMMMTTPPNLYARALKAAKDPNTLISITTTPLWKTHFDQQDYLFQIYNRFSKASDRFIRLSYQLRNKKWLNIQIDAYPKIQFITLLIIAIEFLTLCIVLAYVWTIRRYTQPLGHLKNVVENLGSDLNPTAVPIYGPAKMQEVLNSVNEMQQRIAKLIKERTLTLAALSHDLRTPVTRLRLRTEFIEDKNKQSAILQDIQTIDQIIDNTLIFAKQNYQDHRKHPLDMVSLIQTICEEMQDMNAHVLCKTVIPHQTILGEPVSLRRALTNLIHNAIQYGHEANITVKKENEKLAILIEDTGPGIPETELEKVLEPFYRLEASRSNKTGGTGLGLALVKTIIESHQGTLQLQNLKLGGLQVRIEFNFVA